MNIDSYSNFVCIVEEGTILAASKKLHIAQPALSNQIKALEAQYGAQLLVRTARHANLTDAGRILYKHAKTMGALQVAIHKEIAACAAGNCGTLWLGISPDMADPDISKMLLEFHKANPEVVFALTESTADVIIDQLSIGMIEIGIIDSAETLPSFLTSEITIKGQVMAVYRRDNPWLICKDGGITVSMLKNIPLSISRDLQDSVCDICREKGFVPKIFSVSTSGMGARMWAQNGASVAIIADTATGMPEDEDMCCCPVLDADIIVGRTFAVRGKGWLSCAAKDFLDFCQKQINAPIG